MFKNSFVAVIGIVGALLSFNGAALADDMEVYKEAYNWAYAQAGLNMNSEYSRAFADRFSKLEDGHAALSRFQEAFRYAYAQSGLNMNKDRSVEFAEKFVSRQDAEEVLKKFNEIFNYAYAQGGLNLNKDQSMKFAEEKSGLAELPKPKKPAAPVCRIPSDKAAAIKLLADLDVALGLHQKEIDGLMKEVCEKDKLDSEAYAKKFGAILESLQKDISTLGTKGTEDSKKSSASQPK